MSFSALLLLNLAVLVAVLSADLGTRKVSVHRVLRPLLLALALIPLFVKHLPTSGNDLWLELVGLAAGSLLGMAATKLLRVRRDPGADRAVSHGGPAYALFWIAIVGARLWFSWAADHGLGPSVGTFLAHHSLSLVGLTNALVFFSLAMAVARGVALGFEGRRARRAVGTPALVRAGESNTSLTVSH